MANATPSLVAIQSGGYTHSWKSGYVLGTLLVGLALIAAFVVWEWKGAKAPIVPRELFQGQRTIGVTFVLLFIAGMNFYSLINCTYSQSGFYGLNDPLTFLPVFPISFTTVYNPDPIQVGLKGLGYGISVTSGAVVFNWLLSIFKNNNRELMIASCVIMSKSIYITMTRPSINGYN